MHINYDAKDLMSKSMLLFSVTLYYESVKLKTETFETDDKLQKPRHCSLSQSGIQSELSNYDGDLDPDQTAIEENVRGFTSLKNRSGRRYADNVAPYSSTAIRKQEEMILNTPNDADQEYDADRDEEKTEEREMEWNEMLHDKALKQAWDPARLVFKTLPRFCYTVNGSLSISYKLPGFL